MGRKNQKATSTVPVTAKDIEEDFLLNESQVPLPSSAPLHIEPVSSNHNKFTGEEGVGLVNSISKFLSKNINVWVDYPIYLPPTLLERIDPENSGYSRPIFKDIQFDERERVARDANGNLKRLNKEQYESIRKAGTFEVPSEQFKGESYKWELSHFAQVGWLNNRNNFKSRMKSALKLIFYLIPKCLTSLDPNAFSLPNGIRNTFYVFYELLDLFIGMRWMVPKFSQYDINKQLNTRRSFHVFHDLQELDVKDKEVFRDGKRMEVFGIFSNGVFKLNNRIYDPSVSEDIANKINLITEEIQKEWIIEEPKFQQELAASLSNNPELTSDQISQKILEACFEKEKELLQNRLKQKMNGEILQVLERYCEAKEIAERINKLKQDEIRQNSLDIEIKIKQNHPIRSLVSAWLNERIQEEMSKLELPRNKRFNNMIIESLRDKGLHEYSYVALRHIEFYTDMAPAITKMLLANRVPIETFSFTKRIWNPKNWIIKKDLNTGSYYYSTSEKLACSTRYPFWRFAILFNEIYTFFMNINFNLVPVMLLNGPLSIKALFLINPYFPSSTVNTQTGVLQKDTSFKIETFISRISGVWAHIARSRAEFESKPDTGIIGKRMTRLLNQIWNYIIKGLIGTLILVLIWPILCLLNIFICSFLSLTSFVWVPLLCLFLYFTDILIFDRHYFDVESGSLPIRSRSPFVPALFTLLWKVGFLSLGNLFGSLFLCLLYIFGFLIITFASSFMWFVRSIWDGMFFYLVLKPLARVPISDNFLARCVNGPGLSRNHFIRFTPKEASMFLELELEKIELNYFENFHRMRINLPVNKYYSYISEIFSPFSTVSGNGTLVRKLGEDTSKFLDHLNKLTNGRKSRYNFFKLPYGEIKMTSEDLAFFIQNSLPMVEEFMNQRIFPNYLARETFFRAYGLPVDDWGGLTNKLIETTFSSGFFVPIEESDKSFSLEIQHLSVKRFLDNIFENRNRDDLEMVKARIAMVQMRRFHRENLMTWAIRYYGIHDSSEIDAVCVRKSSASRYNLIDEEREDSQLLAVNAH